MVKPDPKSSDLLAEHDLGSKKITWEKVGEKLFGTDETGRHTWKISTLSLSKVDEVKDLPISFAQALALEIIHSGPGAEKRHVICFSDKRNVLKPPAFTWNGTDGKIRLLNRALLAHLHSHITEILPGIEKAHPKIGEYIKNAFPSTFTQFEEKVKVYGWKEPPEEKK